MCTSAARRMRSREVRTSGNRELGTIKDSDWNPLDAFGGGANSPRAFREGMDHVLEGKPSVLAMCVGMPDPVLYPSDVATVLDRHLLEVQRKTWEDVHRASGTDWETIRDETVITTDFLVGLRRAGTDPLQVSIEACRAQGILLLPSYRMNAEDYYQNSYLASDLGREHPEWRIPLTAAEKQEFLDAGVSLEFTGAMDYAVPEVFEQRMRIFAEVADRYDIDGIEFDFRRWYHMISNPLENHPVLTRLIRETRRMLDDTARRSGRDRLLLGVRVGPSLDLADDPNEMLFPGITFPCKPVNSSCSELGLDVRAWIEEELVDYVCPALFNSKLPGVPRVREFTDLARGRDVGIYPTVFSRLAWSRDEPGEGVSMNDLPDDRVADMMRRHRDAICHAALQCFEQGADGISTFNWFGYFLYGRAGCNTDTYDGSVPYRKTQLFAHACLGSPEDLNKCLQARPRVSAAQCEWEL